MQIFVQLKNTGTVAYFFVYYSLPFIIVKVKYGHTSRWLNLLLSLNLAYFSLRFQCDHHLRTQLLSYSKPAN